MFPLASVSAGHHDTHSHSKGPTHTELHTAYLSNVLFWSLTHIVTFIHTHTKA